MFLLPEETVRLRPALLFDIYAFVFFPCEKATPCSQGVT